MNKTVVSAFIAAAIIALAAFVAQTFVVSDTMDDCIASGKSKFDCRVIIQRMYNQNNVILMQREYK